MNNSSTKLWTKWKSGDIRKIAVDLPQGLGDQIMCFPLLSSLKKYYSDINITALVSNPGSHKLLSYNRNIDRVITYDLDFSVRGILKFFLSRFIKVFLSFNKEDFDLIIYIHPNPVRSLLYFLFPARRKVYNRINKHKFYEVEDILNYLKVPVVADYSISFDYSSGILSSNNLEKNGYIVIDLYAQHLEQDPRQWPYFNELISALRTETSKKIVLTGINRGHVAIPGVVDLINRTSLDELLFIVKNAALVVSMDTFLFHISYVFKTPVIALFGPVNPADREPADEKLKFKTIYKKQDCSPCIENKVRIRCNNNFKCMKEITVHEVIKSVKDILRI